MKLVTAPLHRRLLANGARPGADHVPVLKLFDPAGSATWLFTERDPDHPDRLFGLCDTGQGQPELGTASLAELARARGRLGLPLERDRHFTARHPLSVYAAAARRAGRIVERGAVFDDAVREHSAEEPAPGPSPPSADRSRTALRAPGK